MQRNKQRLFYVDGNEQGQWVKVANENDPFTITDPNTLVRYGKGSVWINKTYQAGTYIGSTGEFGNDPVPNVFKEIQLFIPAVVNTPQTFNQKTGSSSTALMPKTENWYSATWVKWAAGLVGAVLLVLLIRKMIK
jgi:hypothetical protein